MTLSPLDRRPIAARQLRIFRTMASSLARAGVSPNAISVAGMFAGLGAGACLAITPRISEDRAAWLCAAALIPLRLLANMLDGMVAEVSGRTSKVGELYNEIPDRVSDSAVLVGLGYAMSSSVPLGFAAAILAMLTAYIRAVGKAAGAPQAFGGPMAKQQRMALVVLTAIFFGLMPQEFRMWSWQVPRSHTRLGIPAIVLLVISLGCAVTCVRRLRFVCARLGSPS
ncbi:MAG: CDP-alcohol phosphatidyltransferase family protein [Phycisphaerales bacterium]